MGDLSKNFSRAEHSCECGCGFDTVDKELNDVLEDVREYFNAEVTITGPNRCKKHNKAVGGAPESLHPEAKAADIKVKGVSPMVVADYLDAKYQDKYGIGRYHNRVHIDVRPTRARWTV